jgi:hypothetical protein
VSAGFSKIRGGGVRLRVRREEAAVLRALIDQLVTLMGEPDESSAFEGMPDVALSDNTSVSDDPVLARLFPDAYEKDPEAASDFRRYTEASLRDGKRAAAEVVLATLGDGGEVVLDDDEAQSWLRALNDVRLALGTRLEITEESLEKMRGFDWDDPRNAGFAAYDWLTYLQDSLVHALW